MNPKKTPRSSLSQTKNINSLFTKGLAAWKSDPELAFESWLIHQGFNNHSINVYSTQWSVFVKWCRNHNVDIHDVDSTHIKFFLNSLVDNKLNQRQRYLRLIERAFDVMIDSITHENKANDVRVNPVRSYQVLFDPHWKQAQHNDETFFYAQSEREQLIQVMRDSCAFGQNQLLNNRAKSLRRQIRDRAILTLFLMAGLKVREVLALRLKDISIKNANTLWIHVHAYPDRPARILAVNNEPANWMLEWIELRSQDPVGANSLVFCSQKNQSAIHATTIARLVRDFFIDLKAQAPRFGMVTAQRLRNSYAASLFDAGMDPNDVALKLGYAEVISAHRLFEAWQQHEAIHTKTVLPNGIENT